MKMPEYRICRDQFLGYCVQIKRRWWPWWCTIGITYSSVEIARKYAEGHAGGLVEHLGIWIGEER